jgi:hypothetical protein
VLVLTQISRSFSELGRVGQSAARHEVDLLETEGEMELRAVDAEV